jgi:hypothetical protein
MKLTRIAAIVVLTGGLAFAQPGTFSADHNDAVNQAEQELIDSLSTGSFSQTVDRIQARAMDRKQRGKSGWSTILNICAVMSSQAGNSAKAAELAELVIAEPEYTATLIIMCRLRAELEPDLLARVNWLAIGQTRLAQESAAAQSSADEFQHWLMRAVSLLRGSPAAQHQLMLRTLDAFKELPPAELERDVWIEAIHQSMQRCDLEAVQSLKRGMQDRFGRNPPMKEDSRKTKEWCDVLWWEANMLARDGKGDLAELLALALADPWVGTLWQQDMLWQDARRLMVESGKWAELSVLAEKIGTRLTSPAPVDLQNNSGEHAPLTDWLKKRSEIGCSALLDAVQINSWIGDEESLARAAAALDRVEVPERMLSRKELALREIEQVRDIQPMAVTQLDRLKARLPKVWTVGPRGVRGEDCLKP